MNATDVDESPFPPSMPNGNLTELPPSIGDTPEYILDEPEVSPMNTTDVDESPFPPSIGSTPENLINDTSSLATASSPMAPTEENEILNDPDVVSNTSTQTELAGEDVIDMSEERLDPSVANNISVTTNTNGMDSGDSNTIETSPEVATNTSTFSPTSLTESTSNTRTTTGEEAAAADEEGMDTD
eukprot:scaffold27025_cov142-Cylindrotheca_fusiformis.AAC.1